MKRSGLRAIPAVEKVMQSLGELSVPRPLAVAYVRRELASLRGEETVPGFETVLERVRRTLAVLGRSRIQPVINGTGIVIHTNLGRAPLPDAALRLVGGVGRGYSNLEYDLSTGRRGRRGGYVEEALAVLCGAEAAMVVNNCAAALVLVLRHFTATKREVVISRGELIQIGGGFRIPEILEASGARLKEVGTTNRTSARDYVRGISRETGLILKVHRSNFFMGGFVEAADTAELAEIARRRKVPLVEDLGSGAVVATERFGLQGGAEILGHEPMPREVLKLGADLVCFSGDKLMGGPQAGIIVGRRKRVAALKREPFFRAMRCDKLVLSALQSTVEAYLNGESTPVLEMLDVPLEVLRARGRGMVKRLKAGSIRVAVGTGKAEVGGGTMPQARIDSVTLDLEPGAGSLAELSARLREGSVPVVGYVSGNRYKIDLRTVFPDQDDVLVGLIGAVS